MKCRPVLNSQIRYSACTAASGATLPEVLSPFLIGRTFVREHCCEYSANIVGSHLGEHLPREYSSGYSSNCDEAIFRVQKASLNMFWEYSPYSTNLASDWLRAESSHVDEGERATKKMRVSLGTSLASEGIC